MHAWGLAVSWAPNGRHIAFTRILEVGSTTRGRIFIMRPDGSHPRQITHPGTRYGTRTRSTPPQVSGWSSSASTRSATRTRSSPSTRTALSTQRITPWRLGCAQGVDWSPNGRWILGSCTEDDQSELWLVHPDGRALHALTDSGSGVQWLSSSFTPNGLRIVSSRTPGVGPAGNADVYVMCLRWQWPTTYHYAQQEVGQRAGLGAVMRFVATGLQTITPGMKWDSGPDRGPRR